MAGCAAAPGSCTTERGLDAATDERLSECWRQERGRNSSRGREDGGFCVCL